MTPEQFCYWLQGRAEMQPDNAPSEAEWKMICEHLATVFNKVTPPLRPHIPASPSTEPVLHKRYIAECRSGAISVC